MDLFLFVEALKIKQICCCFAIVMLSVGENRIRVQTSLHRDDQMSFDH